MSDWFHAHPDVVRVSEERADGALVVPIADRAAVAMATGLAIGGKRVVVDLTATGRLPAVLEALAEAASIAAGGEFPVALVVRVPYGGDAGPRVDREALDAVAAIDVAVWCAVDAGDVGGILDAALATGRPAVVLEPRAAGPARNAPIAPTRVVREGDHATVLAWGSDVAVAAAAADTLAAEGLSVGVIALLRPWPLDAAASDAVARTGRLVVVGEAGLAGRLHREVAARAFDRLEAPPAAARPDAAAIAGAVRTAVRDWA